MKNLLVVVGVVLMMAGGVFAAYGEGVDAVVTMASDNGFGGEMENVMGNGSGDGMGPGFGEGAQMMEQVRMRIHNGTYMLGDGQQLMVQAGFHNQIRLEVGGQGANSSMAINQEMVNDRLRLSANLSNGRNAEIKVMPDVASETALERLRLRACSEENNCTIELKEVGQGNEARLAYEVKTQRRSRVFGIFGAGMNVDAEIDAETGEVLSVNKPWWAFLASEPEE